MNQGTEPDIPYSRPSLGTEEEEAVLRVLRSGWLTTGAECARFEEEFRSMTGADHAIAVSSATAGLHLSLLAAGIKAGDFVVTTPLTFVATTETIIAAGAKPVFADINPDTGNICPKSIAAILKKCSAKAILPVHFGGLSCPMKEIMALADQYGCAVIEDAAHSFPAHDDSGYAGTHGTTGVYSFYANKTITCGEGGMIVTADEKIARQLRLLRMHGIDRDVWQRFTSTSASWQYDVTAAGYKYNLPDVLAAIGREQLKKAHAMHARRVAIAKQYRQGFGACDFLDLPPHAPSNSYHLFQIRINPEKLKIGRDDFIAALQAKGIGVSVHYIPLHTMSYYREMDHYQPQDLPAALNWFERCISLPIYPDLSDKEVSRIIEAVIGTGQNHHV